MEAVWRSLSRRPRLIPTILDLDYVEELVLECFAATVGPNRWERKTRAEQVKEAQAIASAAAALADLLEHSGSRLDNHFLYFLNEDQKVEIGQLFEIPEPLMDHFVDYGLGKALDDTELPLLKTMLRVLAKKARRITHEPKILTSPNAEGAARTYFFRRMNMYMNQVYGSPLHQVVETLSRICLDDPSIDTNAVRDSLRFWRQ